MEKNNPVLVIVLTVTAAAFTFLCLVAFLLFISFKGVIPQSVSLASQANTTTRSSSANGSATQQKKSVSNTDDTSENPI